MERWHQLQWKSFSLVLWSVSSWTDWPPAAVFNSQLCHFKDHTGALVCYLICFSPFTTNHIIKIMLAAANPCTQLHKHQSVMFLPCLDVNSDTNSIAQKQDSSLCKLIIVVLLLNSMWGMCDLRVSWLNNTKPAFIPSSLSFHLHVSASLSP